MQVMLVNLIAFGSQLRASSIVSLPMSACVGAYIDNSCIIRVPIRHERNWNTRAPPFLSSTKLVRLLIYHPLFNACLFNGCLLYSKLGLNWERIYVTFVDCLESERNILDASRKKVWLFSINVINLKIFFNRKIKFSSILQRRSIKFGIKAQGLILGKIENSRNNRFIRKK